MDFEWDLAKEAANLRKHGISFLAAAQVLSSGATFHFQSDRGDEARWIAIGVHPASPKLIAVVYTMREGRYRIVSPRRARKNEEEEYRKRIERGSPKAEQ